MWVRPSSPACASRSSRWSDCAGELSSAWRRPAPAISALWGGVALDDGDAVGAGDDGRVGDAEEKAVLDHAGHALEGLVERLGIVDARERAVEKYVAAVGHEGAAVLGQPQLDLARAADVGGHRADQRARGGEPEAHRFDGKRKLAEHPDALGCVGDDDHALGGHGHDLLAQQRTAAALDEAQVGVDLVGAIDRQIEERLVVERGERDAQALGLRRACPPTSARR